MMVKLSDRTYRESSTILIVGFGGICVNNGLLCMLGCLGGFMSVYKESKDTILASKRFAIQ